MEQVWNDYLQEIQLPERLLSIIESKINDVQSIFGTEIKTLFVSNRRTANGVEYLSLWLFSDDKAFECKNFISSDDYDVVYIQKNISYVNVKKSNYVDLRGPVNESSLVCNCYLVNTSLSCSLNAVGANCKYLMQIIQSQFIANMFVPTVSSDF